MIDVLKKAGSPSENIESKVVPEGKHKIDFYFEPQIVKLGINVRLISILLTFSFIAYMFYKKTKR